MSDNLVTIDCPYCGSPHLLPLEEDCDPFKMQAKAAMECTCTGSWLVRTKEKITNAVVKDTDDEDCAEAVAKMLGMMRDELFDKITVKKDQYTYTFTKNSDNVIKFKRQEQKKEEMTIL